MCSLVLTNTVFPAVSVTDDTGASSLKLPLLKFSIFAVCLTDIKLQKSDILSKWHILN